MALKTRFRAWYKQLENRLLNIAKSNQRATQVIDPRQAILSKMTNWQRHQWHKAKKPQNLNEIMAQLDHFSKLERPKKLRAA